MMVSKEEMVDVLKTAAVSRVFFCPGLYLAIGVSSWANYYMRTLYTFWCFLLICGVLDNSRHLRGLKNRLTLTNSINHSIDYILDRSSILLG